MFRRKHSITTVRLLLLLLLLILYLLYINKCPSSCSSTLFPQTILVGCGKYTIQIQNVVVSRTLNIFFESGLKAKHTQEREKRGKNNTVLTLTVKTKSNNKAWWSFSFFFPRRRRRIFLLANRNGSSPNKRYNTLENQVPYHKLYPPPSPIPLFLVENNFKK